MLKNFGLLLFWILWIFHVYRYKYTTTEYKIKRRCLRKNVIWAEQSLFFARNENKLQVKRMNSVRSQYIQFYFKLWITLATSTHWYNTMLPFYPLCGRYFGIDFSRMYQSWWLIGKRSRSVCVCIGFFLFRMSGVIILGFFISIQFSTEWFYVYLH